MHKALESLLAEKNGEQAVAAYKVMKKDTAHYYIDWLAMDQLGNQLFTLKRYEDARIIFENNASEFPERDLTLFSLAKTYEITGRKEDAITWYKKVLIAQSRIRRSKEQVKRTGEK